MIKRFCDCCEKQITDENVIKWAGDSDRLKNTISNTNDSSLRLTVEVITAKNNTWNDGDFCKYCVLDSLYRLDDRPKLA